MRCDVMMWLPWWSSRGKRLNQPQRGGGRRGPEGNVMAKRAPPDEADKRDECKGDECKK